MTGPGEPGGGWIERLVRLGESVGLNPVRLRWKLIRLERRWSEVRSRSAARVEHAGYEHQVCPRCGRLNDRSVEACHGCGQPLGGRSWQVLSRLGLGLPEWLSVSALLAGAMAIVYARMLAASGGGFAFDVRTLYAFGGNWWPAVLAGEWWRLGTAVFLHGSVMHIGFNTIALLQVGPVAEHLFGRGRVLLLFMVTGLAASLASGLLPPPALSIGASGAVMGLVGLVAAWGHREGTTIGRLHRNMMLKWLAYVTLFGLMIGSVDHAAHFGGFLCGAGLGLVLEPRGPGVPHPGDAMAAAAGALLAALSVGLALFPPA